MKRMAADAQIISRVAYHRGEEVCAEVQKEWVKHRGKMDADSQIYFNIVAINRLISLCEKPLLPLW